MKFLADMGISPQTVAFLRQQGYEAVHLHEEGLDRLEDAAILAKVREEGRILLTHDLGFSELVATSGAMVPSVIVFRLPNMRPENVNRCLQRIIEQHGEVLEQGAIISVTAGRMRVRALPLRANA